MIENVQACLGCEFREQNSRPRCLRDGRRRFIDDLAASAACPMGKHSKDSTPLPGAPPASRSATESNRRAAIAEAVRPICEACPSLIGFPDNERVECAKVVEKGDGGCACVWYGVTGCPVGKWGAAMEIIESATPPVPSATRPGDLVHLLIKRMGFVATSGCGCAAMQKKMNDWGWWRCAFVHRGEIVEWFVARAADAGVTVTSQTVWGLLRAAIREFAGGRANRASKPD